MPERPVERKLAAIFAADIAGYSRLMAADEAGTVARLKAARGIVDGLIGEHRGRIFNTAGDSVVADFASAVEALQCAVAVQATLDAADPPDSVTEKMQFRIGIHVGDVIVDGGNLLGDGVNIAARLEALAEPGAICISASAREHVGNKLPLAFADLGEQAVKNIAQPIHAFRVVTETMAAPPEPAALPLPDKPSIAVLAFQNMSGDPEQEFFSDGIAEDIITALSKLRWFFVIARNSSFTYKGRAVDVKQVGRELGVRYVLEGSVRKGGNRLRITAQLVDAATGNHVWAERYDRDIADIFAVQDEITERVVAAIEPELYGAENIRSQRKPPESLDAWECIIRALSLVGEVTLAATNQAEALCRRAVTIAPGYSQAHSLLAWIIVRRTVWSGDIGAVLPEALAEARTALGLDDRDPWAHIANGLVLWRMRRPAEAERALRRALELNPNSALGYAYLGVVLVDQEIEDEAIRNAEHALRLSPSDRHIGLRASMAIAGANFGAKRYSEAVHWARNTLEQHPEHVWAHAQLIASTATQGDMKSAAEAVTNAVRIRPDFSLARIKENFTISGERGERFFEALRKAGVPEG